MLLLNPPPANAQWFSAFDVINNCWMAVQIVVLDRKPRGLCHQRASQEFAHTLPQFIRFDGRSIHFWPPWTPPLDAVQTAVEAGNYRAFKLAKDREELSRRRM
jgi:hypothetical protein